MKLCWNCRILKWSYCNLNIFPSFVSFCHWQLRGGFVSIRYRFSYSILNWFFLWLLFVCEEFLSWTFVSVKLPTITPQRLHKCQTCKHQTAWDDLWGTRRSRHNHATNQNLWYVCMPKISEKSRSVNISTRQQKQYNCSHSLCSLSLRMPSLKERILFKFMYVFVWKIGNRTFRTPLCMICVFMPHIQMIILRLTSDNEGERRHQQFGPVRFRKNWRLRTKALQRLSKREGERLIEIKIYLLTRQKLINYERCRFYFESNNRSHTHIAHADASVCPFP